MKFGDMESIKILFKQTEQKNVWIKQMIEE